MANQKNIFSHRVRRQTEAQDRQEKRNKRTPQEQLAIIATRRGNSKKETKRLLKLIQK